MQNLRKRQALIEADVAAHQDRIDGIRIADDKFVTSQHFNAEKIHEKQTRVAERYEGLKEPMAERKRRLDESLLVQKLFRDAYKCQVNLVSFV